MRSECILDCDQSQTFETLLRPPNRTALSHDTRELRGYRDTFSLAPQWPQNRPRLVTPPQYGQIVVAG